MDKQVLTEALDAVGMLIHHTRDWYFILSGTQNRRLIIFLEPTSICWRLKQPPGRNRLTSQLTSLLRYIPAT